MIPVSTYSPSIHAASIGAVPSSSTAAPPPSIATLLPEPGHVDVGLAVAQLAIESAYTSRAQARADRRQAEEAMREAEQKQLGEMKREAENKYVAACAEAVAKMVEGGFELTGGVVAARGDEALGGCFSAGGRLVGSTGSLLSAGWREEADQAATSAKAAENEASAHRRAIDHADDEIKEARDHVRTALDFLRELESTQSKSMSSAIRA